MNKHLLSTAAWVVALGVLPKAQAQEVPENDEVLLQNLLDMVVSATLREQSTLDAPASIQVVTAADIRARGYRTIKAVMNDVPGFNDVADTNEEIVAVRGIFASTTNKILFLVNGHRMNDLMLGRYNTDQFLGLEAVERIEFIRGPGSALYGSSALAGVVNIITRKGGDLGGAQLKAQGGPYGQEANASFGKQILGYDVFFNAAYLNAVGSTINQPDGYDVAPMGQTPAPGRIYVDRYPENLSGLFTLRSDTSALTLRGAHFRRVTPRGGNGSFYDYQTEPLKPAYTENDFFIDYVYHLNFGTGGQNKLTINPSLHYFSYYEQSFINFGANRLPPLGTRSGMTGEFNQYQLRLTYERQLLESLNVIGGLDGLLSSFYRSDAVTIVNNDTVVLTPSGYTTPGRWFLGGAFAQAVFSPFRWASLTVGGRFDTFQKEAKPRLTPRVGLVLKPVETLVIKALFGQSYLAPMWAHKRANDGNFVGNPDLAPESFTGVDFIVAYGSKRLSISIDLFYNSMIGLINAAPVPGTNKLVYSNTADSAYGGGEASVDGQMLSWLRVWSSLSYIRANLSQTTSTLLVGEQIKDIPALSYRFGARVDPLPRLSFSLWGRGYTATRTVDAITGLDTIPAVVVLDGALTYTWPRVTLQLIGNNLTDQYYERGGTVPRPLARKRLNVEGSLAIRF
jgi:outer membrane receptor for ferrienterochelin and colicins